ncbi:MAG: hypothetical protein IJE10_08850 [Clostridia bacterium]|nr:hypothetical protein [Clostridia bacterium]
MKKRISFLLIFVMLVGMLTIPAQAADVQTIFIAPENFQENLGSWTYKTSDVADAFKSILIGRSDKAQNLLKPAGVNVVVPADGTYTVYVRTRDYDTHPGTRKSQIAVNGTIYPHILGAHGTNGWAWETVGEVSLKKGTSTVQLVDITGYTPRVEGIILSTDKNIKLPENASAFGSFASKYACTAVPGALVSPIYEEKPVETNFKSDKVYSTLDYTSFSPLGTWEIKSESGTMLDSFLFSTTKSANASDNAKAVFGVTQDGVYDVWVHTKDSSNNPGSRSFYLTINNNEPVLAGGHGNEGWHWDKVTACPLFAGEHTLSLSDYRGNFSRVDMIVITNDKEFKIGENKEIMHKLQNEYLYKSGSAKETKATDNGQVRPSDEIAVEFNGSYMTFDVPPLLINDRTMVPMRAIFEALGCTVSWNNDTQTATGMRNGSIVSLTIDSDVAQVNNKKVSLDAPAALINDRTMIPLRFVSEALGASVKWEGDTNTVRILADIPSAAYFLRPESFEALGTWFMESGQADAFNQTTLRGLVKPEDNPAQTAEDYNNPKPATAYIPVAKGGQYRIWVHSKDFETSSPGTRYFNIGVNGKMHEQKFGTHGKNGYRWADAGVFTLNEGTNSISLYDTSKFYARCDGVLIVEDLGYIPEESYSVTSALAKPYNPASTRSTEFPKWAKEQNAPTESIAIENEYTKVIFHKVPTQNGIVIQNEIYAKKDGKWVLTNKRDEPLGYLMMQADDSLKAGSSAEIAAFKNTYTENGIEKNYIGSDVYSAGTVNWMIPNDYTVNGNTVTLLFPDNNYASLQVVWSLDDGRSPKVTLDASFKTNGAYSFGCFEGQGFADYDFAMIPYRIMSKQVAGDRGLTTQQSAMTPMSTYTLPANNIYNANKVTKGVVVEPSWLPIMWNYTENNMFGLASIDASGAYGGGVFAPLFGTEACKFYSGDTYNFSYRVISEVSDWYDSYKHIATDLFEVKDYRTNYYTSLNEGIYNTIDLMMDDDLGGWNKYAKGFYNMESSYMATNANPMALLQAYQLTENKDILERRTVPTIANLLTRPNLHMNWTTNKSSQAWGQHEIGSPIKYYNLNVMGGVYEQTGGTLPWLLNYSIEKAKAGTVNETASAVAPFMNDLHLYKYTGDESYLKKAIATADKYLEDVVYAPRTTQQKETVFVYSGYYPSLSSLLDIYDVTGDKKYLDAAEYTGRWISAMVQTAGVDSSKRNQMITVNDPLDVAVRWQGGKGEHLSSSFWWHGDVIWRQGTTPGNPADTDKAYALMREHIEDVPLWVASNVGLGVEQPVTFGGSSYITMQCWAGDMVRLAYLTGDDYFESVARNAIVGRFGGYSGYYLQRFWTYYMQPEYGFNGPDFTNIYWHHIPQFYAMLCDFLVNQISAKSDYLISFPGLRQQGYAYFDSNQYGYAPGKFYDEDGMWLWLDRGIVTPNSVQIDYLTAKKDGMFAAAFLNEGNEAVTTEIVLGEKLPGSQTYTGSATLYDNAGNKSEIQIENGKFMLTIQPKALVSVKISLPDVKAPSYALLKYTLNGKYDVKQSVAEHENGKAFAIQLSPDEYFAYIYVTDTEETASAIKVYYTIGDSEEQMAEMDVYPYEVILPVQQPVKPLTYRIELVQNDGSVKKIPGGTIIPIGSGL